MIRLPRRRPRHMHRESGQSALLIFLFIFVLLLGLLGFATDYAQLFARRQMAQGAADAACQAAAADLFIKQTNPSATTVYSLDYSWIPVTAGTGAFDCSSYANSSPCIYASRNGFSGSKVAVSFPASVPGYSLSGFGTVTIPYIKVTITEPVGTSFSRLFQASVTSLNTGATAVCGLNPVAVPVPLVVLHSTSAASFDIQGNPTITFIGGPNRSVQVDSSSATAVNVGGSAVVDMTAAGPSNTGADFGVFGTETKPAGVSLGTGKWVSPATPFGDPWATVAAPSVPGTSGMAIAVGFMYHGCPDPSGCVEFTAGNFSSCSTANNLASGANACLKIPFGGSNARFANFGSRNPNTPYPVGSVVQPTNSGGNNASLYYFTATASTSNTSSTLTSAISWPQTIGSTITDGGVTWENVGQNLSTSPGTAIFQPGLYYLGAGGLDLGSNSTVRMSTANGDGSQGATFYFSTSASVNVSSNAGNKSACPTTGTPSNCITSFKTNGTATVTGLGSVANRSLQCPGGAFVPAQVPASIDGNILLGPCSGTYGDTTGQNRGFLFFQNRSTFAQPNWGGGGQFLLSGFMYFHSSTTGTTCGTNTTCLTLQGNSGAGAFTLGNIVTDEIALGGSSGIKMILNPASTFQVLKPQLLQ